MDDKDKTIGISLRLNEQDRQKIKDASWAARKSVNQWALDILLPEADKQLAPAQETPNNG